jgi:translation initiation factor 1A
MQALSHNLVFKVGRRKVKNESNLQKMVLPTKNDVLGIAVRILGGERIIVKCQDGKERLCRIRGKLKRRVWIREDDIVLVSPWDFQSDTRGDIFWRYRKNQSDWLRNKGYLKM